MLLPTKKPFNSFPPQICFQEVPDEVSLAFTITGCPLACAGCHSRDTWDPDKGRRLAMPHSKSGLSDISI
ncbi:4Fe-4S cluster-binding domain-containing protein [Lacimicrobium alkaliphilum]|uniref:4Fe-4S cluster-binding domain-containing protein n=1 Tax=Lacimicrobium alkaliphilum TaxID=1526571 RepID=UPI001E65566F|nr:4Fe-4S cluster-binding domain-containing protein [Lacimicrobium alkaliphilum]